MNGSNGIYKSKSSNLEEWDNLSPLNQSELDSINLILSSTPAATTTPPPPTTTQSPITTATTLKSIPSTAIPSISNLLLSEPIKTTQQFHDWFSLVERGIELSQEEIYRIHLTELNEYISSCDTVLSQLDDARGLISVMEANYRFVEDNSRALQQACETMLDEQKHLIEVTEAIGARLGYFRELEGATKMLNLPGESLVLQDDFLNMLDRLDVCLEYLKANRDFKDAEIYTIRFQQCLTRAMTLIKMYFVSVIRKLTSEVAEKSAGKDLSETAMQALLYTKFYTTSELLRVLIFELEKRAKLEPDEYGSLLKDCYQAWFWSRNSLISGGLAEEVRRMDSGDVVKMARAGCNHLRSVAMTEFTLYKNLFSTGETELYQFLESLCDYLYDSLRPRILHEPKLEVLCELCTVIGAMMALDSTSNGVDSDSDSEVDGTDFGDEDDDVFDDSASSFNNIGRGGVQPPPSINSSTYINTTTPRAVTRFRFSLLIQTILQDSQTRLVFRAQTVIQNEVLHYVPTAEDLNYPAKLENEDGVSEDGLSLWTEDERLRENDTTGGFRVPRESVVKHWYPALRKTGWVLSRLNSYVNNAIFEDFAGEAVTLCRQSLSNASNTIAIREGNTKLDGQLFLIRHLLLLKEMVRSVDLVHIERAADFSSVTDALINLLRNTSVLFNPNALFELASKGIPSFGETMTDTKTDLDNSLKKTCEALISDSATVISLPLRAFLDKCTSFLSSSRGRGGGVGKDLTSQPWATPEEVLKLHEEFQDSVLDQTKEVGRKMKVYLADQKTIGVLLPPLLDEIMDTYRTFYNLTRSEYGFATSSSLLTPIVVRENLVIAVA